MNQPRTLLEWLGFPARESTSRDLLGWLVATKGPAVLEPVLGFNPGALLGPIRREVPISKESRIDLLFDTERARVGIEVKVHSGSGRRQVARYLESLGAEERPPSGQTILVYLTETGAAIRPLPTAPEIRLVSGTWASICDEFPMDDPLGWGAAARSRRAVLYGRQEQLRGATPLSILPKATHPGAVNELAYALFAFGKEVADRVTVPVVAGPHFGARANDIAVDLARDDWSVPLETSSPHPLLARIDEVGNGCLQFSTRLRLRIDANSMLSLGVGTMFTPYLKSIPGSLRAEVESDRRAALEHGYKLRGVLLEELGRQCETSNKAWHCDAWLLRRQGWVGNRLEAAVSAITEVLPKVQGAVRRWRGVSPGGATP